MSLSPQSRGGFSLSAALEVVRKELINPGLLGSVGGVMVAYKEDEGRYAPAGATSVLAETVTRSEALDAWTTSPAKLSTIKDAIRYQSDKNQLEVIRNGVQFKNGIARTPNNPSSIRLGLNVTCSSYIPRPYISEAKLPSSVEELFIDWLGRQRASQLLEVLAWVMSPTYSPQRAVILNGSGANGKSTFLTLAQRLVGWDNVSAMTFDHLHQETHLHSLQGKLLLVIPETIHAYNHRWTDAIKRLTGADLITARRLYEQPVKFHNNAKILIATNSTPISDDETEGFYRRFTIIDFQKQFLATERDVLSSITEDDLDELASYLVDNVLPALLERHHFAHESSNVKQQREAYLLASNPLPKFIETECLVIPSDSGLQMSTETITLRATIDGQKANIQFREHASRCYNAYKKWLITNNLHVPSRKEFTRALESLGFEVCRMRVQTGEEPRRGIDGLILKNSVPKEALENWTLLNARTEDVN